MHSSFPQKADLDRAYTQVRKYAHRTPVLTSSAINNIAGCELYFKCENLQRGGAFKFRGATNAALSLPQDKLQKGLATHSSGNHAAALCIVAGMLGVPAYIVMPETAPAIKVAAVKGYGGKITFCKPTLEARESTLNQVVEQTGATFIHPYNNYDIIAGQSTACRELLEDVPDLDAVIAPVGGGGLMSGTALSAVNFGKKGIKVFGAEPEGADDAFRSKRDGVIYPSVGPKTIADGLLTSLGDKTFPIICELVDQIITVSDHEITAAMRLIWERMKTVVEPSGATVLAAVIKSGDLFKGKKTGLILSGGNADIPKINWEL
ncbi:MAG: pyridoxal-phosphate dependent enzyme [Ignavibacteriaceae bacterium]|nr:pyridoxal-phosphate dependent enzyme [Ignavibacteriaceae bacterium]